MQAFQASMKAALNPDHLADFAIRGQEAELVEAVGRSTPAAGTLVSVKASGAAVQSSKREKQGGEASLYKKKPGKWDSVKGGKHAGGSSKKQKR
jgi:hypothetical protein